jgi:hypothetical protein
VISIRLSGSHGCWASDRLISTGGGSLVSAAWRPYAAALDGWSSAFAQHQGMSSSMRLLGQPLTSRVSRSVK